jgi:NitT/TauT family transport system substrate-binding protein
MVRWTGRAAAAAVLAALLASGGPAAADEKIVFVTNWKAEAEHGGFYQALALGLYKKRGLDVELRQGGPGIDNVQLIAAGAADMVIASNNYGPLNLAREKTGVVAVMSAFQKDPQIIMTHPDPAIKTLQDLKGRPIMLASGAIGTFWVWLKAAYGYDDAQIRKYTFNMAPFIVDKSAVQQGYVTSEPYEVKKESGIDAKVFLLADSGWASYSAMVAVGPKWLKEKPRAVQDFVDASIEGWYGYIYGDPAPANALIKKDNPEMTDDLIAYGIAKLKEYGVVDSGDSLTLGIGAMTDARWKAFFDVMSAQAIYPKDLDYHRAYTLQFVNKAYAMDMRPK